jgi:hypothetical protein
MFLLRWSNASPPSCFLIQVPPWPFVLIVIGMEPCSCPLPIILLRFYCEYEVYTFISYLMCLEACLQILSKEITSLPNIIITNQVELNCALTCFSIVLWIAHFTIVKVLVALLALLFSLSFCIAYLISFAIVLSIVSLGKHFAKVTTCDVKWSINNSFLLVCLVSKWGKDNKLCKLITSWVKFCDVWKFSYIWVFKSFRFTTSSSSFAIVGMLAISTWYCCSCFNPFVGLQLVANP